DCVIVSPLYGTLTGRAALENAYRNFFGAFPDSIFQFEDPLVFGDQAVQVTAMRGTDTGGLLGEGPTGKPFSNLAAFFMTFGRGLIVHERSIYDRGSLLLQLTGETDRAEETSRLYRSALEKALMAHEVSIAAQIQHALLPPGLHNGAGFEVAAASIPCRT